MRIRTRALRQLARLRQHSVELATRAVANLEPPCRYRQHPSTWPAGLAARCADVLGRRLQTTRSMLFMAAPARFSRLQPRAEGRSARSSGAATRLARRFSASAARSVSAKQPFTVYCRQQVALRPCRAAAPREHSD